MDEAELDVVGYLKSYLENSKNCDPEIMEYVLDDVDKSLGQIFNDIFSDDHIIDYSIYEHATIIFEFVCKLINRSESKEKFSNIFIDVFMNFNFDFSVIGDIFQYIDQQKMEGITSDLLTIGEKNNFNDILINYRILTLLATNRITLSEEIFFGYCDICLIHFNSEYSLEYTPRISEQICNISWRISSTFIINEDLFSRYKEKYFILLSVLTQKLIDLPVGPFHSQLFNIFVSFCIYGYGTKNAIITLIDPRHGYINKLIQSTKIEKIFIMKNLANEIYKIWDRIEQKTEELCNCILDLCVAGSACGLYVEDIMASANHTYYELFFNNTDRSMFQLLFSALFKDLDQDLQDSVISQSTGSENLLYLLTPVISDNFDVCKDNIEDFCSKILEGIGDDFALQLSFIYFISHICNQIDSTDLLMEIYQNGIELLLNQNTSEIARVQLSLFAKAISNVDYISNFADIIEEIIRDDKYIFFEYKLDLIKALTKLLLLEDFPADWDGINKSIMVSLDCAFLSIIDCVQYDECHTDNESIISIPDHMCQIFLKFIGAINIDAYFIAVDLMENFFNLNLENPPTDSDVHVAIAEIAGLVFEPGADPTKLIELLNQDQINLYDEASMVDNLRFDQALLVPGCEYSITILFRNIIRICKRDTLEIFFVEPLINLVCSDDQSLHGPIGHELADAIKNYGEFDPETPIIELLFRIAYDGITNFDDNLRSVYVLLFSAIAIWHPVSNKIEYIDEIIKNIHINNKKDSFVLAAIKLHRNDLTFPEVVSAAVQSQYAVSFIPIVATRILVTTEEIPKWLFYGIYKKILLTGLNRIGLSDAEKTLYKYMFTVIKARRQGKITAGINANTVADRAIASIDANDVDDNPSGFNEIFCTFSVPDRDPAE